MNSRKTAIEKHCKECIFDRYAGSGTWREQTEKCSNLGCNLYPFRPRTTKASRPVNKSLKSAQNSENPSTPDSGAECGRLDAS